LIIKLIKIFTACNESYTVSFSFNKFRIFFGQALWGVITFIYLFIYYLYFNLFTWLKIKESGKNSGVRTRDVQSLDLLARPRLLLGAQFYELLGWQESSFVFKIVYTIQYFRQKWMKFKFKKNYFKIWNPYFQKLITFFEFMWVW